MEEEMKDEAGVALVEGRKRLCRRNGASVREESDQLADFTQASPNDKMKLAKSSVDDVDDNLLDDSGDEDAGAVEIISPTRSRLVQGTKQLRSTEHSSTVSNRQSELAVSAAVKDNTTKDSLNISLDLMNTSSNRQKHLPADAASEVTVDRKRLRMGDSSAVQNQEKSVKRPNISNGNVRASLTAEDSDDNLLDDSDNSDDEVIGSHSRDVNRTQGRGRLSKATPTKATPTKQNRTQKVSAHLSQPDDEEESARNVPVAASQEHSSGAVRSASSSSSNLSEYKASLDNQTKDSSKIGKEYLKQKSCVITAPPVISSSRIDTDNDDNILDDSDDDATYAQGNEISQNSQDSTRGRLLKRNESRAPPGNVLSDNIPILNSHSKNILSEDKKGKSKDHFTVSTRSSSGRHSAREAQNVPNLDNIIENDSDCNTDDSEYGGNGGRDRYEEEEEDNGEMNEHEENDFDDGTEEVKEDNRGREEEEEVEVDEEADEDEEREGERRGRRGRGHKLPLNTSSSSRADPPFDPVLTRVIKEDNSQLFLYLLLYLTNYSESSKSDRYLPQTMSSPNTDLEPDLMKIPPMLNEEKEIFAGFLSGSYSIKYSAGSGSVQSSSVDLYDLLLFSVRENAVRIFQLLFSLEFVEVESDDNPGFSGSNAAHTAGVKVSSSPFVDCLWSAVRKLNISFHPTLVATMIREEEKSEENSGEESEEKREENSRELQEFSDSKKVLSPYSINMNIKKFKKEIIRRDYLNIIVENDTVKKLARKKNINKKEKTVSLLLYAFEEGPMEVVRFISEKFPFYSFNELRCPPEDGDEGDDLVFDSILFCSYRPLLPVTIAFQYILLPTLLLSSLISSLFFLFLPPSSHPPLLTYLNSPFLSLSYLPPSLPSFLPS
jgi:hypothetical protein